MLAQLGSIAANLVGSYLPGLDLLIEASVPLARASTSRTSPSALYNRIVKLLLRRILGRYLDDDVVEQAKPIDDNVDLDTPNPDQITIRWRWEGGRLILIFTAVPVNVEAVNHDFASSSASYLRLQSLLIDQITFSIPWRNWFAPVECTITGLHGKVEVKLADSKDDTAVRHDERSGSELAEPRDFAASILAERDDLLTELERSMIQSTLSEKADGPAFDVNDEQDATFPGGLSMDDSGNVRRSPDLADLDAGSVPEDAFSANFDRAIKQINCALTDASLELDILDETEDDKRISRIRLSLERITFKTRDPTGKDLKPGQLLWNKGIKVIGLNLSLLRDLPTDAVGAEATSSISKAPDVSSGHSLHSDSVHDLSDSVADLWQSSMGSVYMTTVLAESTRATSQKTSEAMADVLHVSQLSVKVSCRREAQDLAQSNADDSRFLTWAIRSKDVVMGVSKAEIDLVDSLDRLSGSFARSSSETKAETRASDADLRQSCFSVEFELARLTCVLVAQDSQVSAQTIKTVRNGAASADVSSLRLSLGDLAASYRFPQKRGKARLGQAELMHSPWHESIYHPICLVDPGLAQQSTGSLSLTDWSDHTENVSARTYHADGSWRVRTKHANKVDHDRHYRAMDVSWRENQLEILSSPIHIFVNLKNIEEVAQCLLALMPKAHPRYSSTQPTASGAPQVILAIPLIRFELLCDQHRYLSKERYRIVAVDILGSDIRVDPTSARLEYQCSQVLLAGRRLDEGPLAARILLSIQAAALGSAVNVLVSEQSIHLKLDKVQSDLEKLDFNGLHFLFDEISHAIKNVRDLLASAAGPHPAGQGPVTTTSQFQASGTGSSIPEQSSYHNVVEVREVRVSLFHSHLSICFRTRKVKADCKIAARLLTVQLIADVIEVDHVDQDRYIDPIIGLNLHRNEQRSPMLVLDLSNQSSRSNVASLHGTLDLQRVLFSCDLREIRLRVDHLQQFFEAPIELVSDVVALDYLDFKITISDSAMEIVPHALSSRAALLLNGISSQLLSDSLSGQKKAVMQFHSFELLLIDTEGKTFTPSLSDQAHIAKRRYLELGYAPMATINGGSLTLIFLENASSTSEGGVNLEVASHRLVSISANDVRATLSACCDSLCTLGDFASMLSKAEGPQSAERPHHEHTRQSECLDDLTAAFELLPYLADPKNVAGAQPRRATHVRHSPEHDLLDMTSPETSQESELRDQAFNFAQDVVTFDASNLDVSIKLYDGYDWIRTRQAIEDAICRQRQRAENIVRMIAGEAMVGSRPGTPDMQMPPTPKLFRSIYIPSSDSKGLSTKEVLEKIDRDIEDVNDGQSETSSRRTGLTLTQSPRSGGRRRRLCRSRATKIEVLAKSVDAHGTNVPTVEGTLTISKLEIIDNLRSSAWKKFMTKWRHGTHDARTDKMFEMCIKGYPTLPPLPGLEYRLDIAMAPVRLFVDQDALLFLKRFFSFRDPDSPANLPSPASDEIFFQQVKIKAVPICLDFKPKHVDFANLRDGKVVELMNFIHFEQSEMVLREVKFNGVSGLANLAEILDSFWMSDITKTQLPGVLSGIKSVSSVVKVGSGAADLVLVPLDHLKKNKSVLRGLQKGGMSFARQSGMEAIKIGARLANGTQILLEGAESLLGGQSPSARLELVHPDELESEALSHDVKIGGVDDVEDDEPKMTSRYANQPLSFREGASTGLSSLRKGFGSAAHAILAVPAEGSEPSLGSSIPRVVKSMPIAVLRPMIGASEAVSKTLLGLRNSLDPSLREELEDKYK